MASSPISKVAPSNKSYCEFVIETFQGYALSELEDSFLWSAILIDFENWTKEIWERLDGNTWGIIRKCYIPRGVWIDEREDNLTRSDILLKLVSTKHNDDLKDWDIGRIREVEKNFGRISRGIQRRKRKLLGNLTDEPQTQALPMQALSIQPALTWISHLAPPTSKF